MGTHPKPTRRVEIGYSLSSEERQPEELVRLAQVIRMLHEEIVCGPDPQPHLEGIAKFTKAGFDHLYVHQVGPDQEGFMRFDEREILPNVKQAAA